MNPVGRISEIWRYPVSSLAGERIVSAEIAANGVLGDRQFALVDAVTGLPAAPEREARWRKALHLRIETPPGQLPLIGFPDGHFHTLSDSSLNALLSDYFGFPAALATHEPGLEAPRLSLTAYRHIHFPLHLLTTASLARLADLRQAGKMDVRRFRPTALIDVGQKCGFVESEWIGHRVCAGAVELSVREETKRCGMTLISQPGLAEDPEVLRNILRHNKRHLGVYCSVDRVGTINVGDEVFVEPVAR